MNADLETKGMKHGEDCEVNAFEGTRDRFTAALLSVRVLMVAKEAEDTTWQTMSE